MSLRRQILPPPRRFMKPDISLAIVNIVLLLVLFFLTSGALIDASGSTAVEVPRSRALMIERLDGPTVEMARDGTILMNGLATPRADLDRMLGAAPQVFLLVDASALAAGLIDLLQDPALAAREVQLVTLDSEDAP